MSESVTLADVERLCWRLSGWTVEQRAVDELMTAIRGVVGADEPAAGLTEGAEPPAERLPEVAATVDPSEAESGPQTGAQSVHVTVECAGRCKGRAPRPRRPHIRVVKRVRVQPVAVPDVVVEDVRACRKCRTVQSITVYARDSHGVRGRKTVCRDCENRRKRDWKRARKAARVELAA